MKFNENLTKMSKMPISISTNFLYLFICIILPSDASLFLYYLNFVVESYCLTPIELT
jgi:hypothetical protein